MKGFQLNWISQFRNELFGISILMIIFFHFSADFTGAVQHGTVDPSQHPVWSTLVLYYCRYIGSIGVEIFVFLSGMGLYYSFSKNHDIKRFYQKRYARILIPYVPVALIFWAIKDLYCHHTGLETFFKDLSFYSLVSRGVHTIWFIGLMVGLYLIFPIIYRFLENRWMPRILSLLVLLIGLWVLIFWFGQYVPELYHNTQIAITRIPVFVLGCYMGKPIQQKKAFPWIAVIFLCILTTWLDVYVIHNSGGSFAVRFSDMWFSLSVVIVLVLLSVLIQKIRWMDRVMVWVGAYSLELYMVHVTLRNLMKEFGFHAYNIAQYLVMVVIAVILSYGLKRLTDRLQTGMLTVHHKQEF